MAKQQLAQGRMSGEITVYDMEGHRHKIAIDRSTTVADLKTKIQLNFKVPAGKQCLLYEKKSILDKVDSQQRKEKDITWSELGIPFGT